MFKILIDTCVWIDLAKDYKQQIILDALEELIFQGNIELILPRIVVDEFSRNKAHVIDDCRRSLSGSLKRAKEIISKFGDPPKKEILLSQLNDIDYRLPLMGESVIDSISRIEQLFAKTKIIESSDKVKLLAAQRAIDKRAPFHRQRNGIDDAILIEVYKEMLQEKGKARSRFAFITHNIKDFSHPEGNNKIPHPDIQDCFSTIKSLYFTSLGEALKRIAPEQFNEIMVELIWEEEPRSLSEILEAIDELSNKVWYNRHQVLVEKIEDGRVEIVDKESFPIIDHETRPVQRDIWEGAKKSAAKVEKKYGIENLGPWDDFEWGMINGKLSALRWILGDDWDTLDT